MQKHTDMNKKTQSGVGLNFASRLERSTNKLWGCHFRVPRQIALKLISGKSRRVVCTLNGSVAYQTALRPWSKGAFVIPVNAMLRRTLAVDVGMDVQVSLTKDRSKYGLPMPDELRMLLRQDPEGNRLFTALTPGRQRTLLHIVGSAKQIEKRIIRAVTIVNHLKAHKGKINYRQLYTSLRDFRH